MKRLFALILCLSAAGGAQTFPTRNYFQRLFSRPATPTQIPAASDIEQHIADGRLRLSLDDAVRLMMANNTEVKISELSYEASRFPLLRAMQPFDPMFVSSFRPTRTVTPSTSELEGAETVSNLTQSTSALFSQAFQTGTSYSLGFSANRTTTNNSFSFFNPSYFSTMTFSVTQPLLRRRGLGVNRAPIVIAQRGMKQSRANFETQVNDAISRTINQYWQVVQARQDLDVMRKSLELAETTNNRNKRALELGALPPLDIHRSEAQVAQRKLQVIQAEYRLKQLEDELRRLIGADLDTYTSTVELELTESVEPSGDPGVVILADATAQALANRPEMEALRQQLAIDDTNIQVATNGLRPDLNITGFYSSNGRGGTLIDDTGVPVNRGSFRDSLDQIGSFDYPTYGVNLELRLPLRNRAAEADLGTAQVNKRRNLYTLRQREQAIRQEVKNAANQLEEARLSVAAAQVAFDLGKKNLAAEERKFELGATTIFFVLEAQTQVALAEQSLVQAKIDFHRSITALDKATGALLDRHKVQLAP